LRADRLLPSSATRLPAILSGTPDGDTIARHQMWTHSIVSVQPLAASGIMTNNMSVSLSAFAMDSRFSHRLHDGLQRPADRVIGAPAGSRNVD